MPLPKVYENAPLVIDSTKEGRHILKYCRCVFLWGIGGSVVNGIDLLLEGC